MSSKNKLANKQARRLEREARKREFVPIIRSVPMTETRKVTDEDTGEEIEEVSESFYHLPSRSDRRGNRVRGRRGKTL